MDISDDSKLLVTCSADKNVKIWGLDFGDCHKSIFAHDDSIMQVAFEKKSHYFWTVAKDKLVKYWDGDKVNSFLPLCLLSTNSLRIHSSRISRNWKVIMQKYGLWLSAIMGTSWFRAPTINLSVFGQSWMNL